MAHGFQASLTTRILRSALSCQPALLVLIGVGADSAPAQETAEYSYARRYMEGETDYYELTVRSAGADSELIGVSEHRTFVGNGIPYERVRWVGLRETKLGDLTSFAREVPPYELSLHPEGELKLPEVGASSMMLGMVTDLYTFFFAVSPDTGIARLTSVGDSYKTPEPLKGDWSDQPRFLLGQDRTEVRIRLAEKSAEDVTYETELLPPQQAGLPMHRSWMEDPVCESTPNSFQMVQRKDHGFFVAWGCEESRVTSRVERSTGKILWAQMNNRLKLRIRLCKDDKLEQCEDQRDVTKLRKLRLVLKPTPKEELPPNLARVNPRDGQEYVLIPPGQFEMGCVPFDKDCYEEEKPRHKVTITQGFWMGRTEVPVQAYEQFAASTGREMPAEPGSGTLPDYNPGWEKKNHPMVKVTWNEAKAYCEWAGGRLPTEAEWEYAARGGVAGLKYPWGNERSHDHANYWRLSGRDQWKHTAPVGSFPPNAFGLYDMAGNVYEWVHDWYHEGYYWRSPSADPQGPARGRLRVARGGSGFINPATLRISTRLRNRPGIRNVGVGFRCVWEATE